MAVSPPSRADQRKVSNDEAMGAPPAAPARSRPRKSPSGTLTHPMPFHPFGSVSPQNELPCHHPSDWMVLEKQLLMESTKREIRGRGVPKKTPQVFTGAGLSKMQPCHLPSGLAHSRAPSADLAPSPLCAAPGLPGPGGSPWRLSEKWPKTFLL